MVTAHVLRWQVGECSVPIEELGREDLLGAVRSLFDINARQKTAFGKEMDEVAEMYEQKIRSLHLALAAHVELEIREAVRDRMDAILAVVAAELDHRHLVTPDAHEEEVNGCQKEGNDGH